MAEQTQPAVSKTEEAEESITLQELLEEEESLQADAVAVLGGSDEKCCSYPHGYVGRQALYACSTCTSDGKPAGICLACSYACHEGHDLYELYTKRNFRCDCGNEKFPNLTCSLFTSKAPSNPDNTYNHNFVGKYCHCDRPYPDPENPEDQEMATCVVCEDWFHLRHIGLEATPTDSFQELVCDSCMKAHPFLWKYKFNLQNLLPADESNNVEMSPKAKRARLYGPENGHDLKVDEQLPENSQGGQENSDLVSGNGTSGTERHVVENGEKDQKTGEHIAENVERRNENQEQKTETNPCILATLPDTKVIPASGAVWPRLWRTILCSCSECTIMYSNHGIEFLKSIEDTTEAYEQRGMEKTKNAPDPLMKALDKLGHVQKIEVIDGYNNLKTKLGEFLRAKAEADEIVTQVDIENFFSKMKQSKASSALPSFFCR